MPLIIVDLLPAAWGRYPESMFADTMVSWIKRTRTRRVGFFTHADVDLVVKLRAHRGWVRGRGFLRGVKTHAETRREWAMLERFPEFGFLVAQRIALLPPFADERGTPWSGFVCTRLVGDTLETLLERGDSRAVSPPVIRELARCARAMHNADCHHQDFYSGHLFLSGPASEPRMGIVDLARACHRPRLRRRWVIKDLAQLAFSTAPASEAARIAFLRAYLGVKKGEQFTRAQRRFTARIMAKRARIARHAPSALARRQRQQLPENGDL